MADLFNTGIRPHIDSYLKKKSEEVRSYGSYWSASQAGYCMRKVIMERMGIPPVAQDARKQRVFEAGHIFHEWVQRITKNAGISIAQELELQDEALMVRGHIDDLILTGSGKEQNLVLYDYKTQNSRAFSYQKGKPISHFHKMQLGTYMLMLRQGPTIQGFKNDLHFIKKNKPNEARILKISKDDLRMSEQQLLWSPELEAEILTYWRTINTHWANKTLPPCACHEHENGFMAKEAYNPFYFNGQPCSQEWYERNKDDKQKT